ncbi:Tetratricopeptide TPR_4 [Parafrankia sp. EAN1pec]|nr:Tetratricopeptide TPR_4 [Frankia sp. EAN1pec]
MQGWNDAAGVSVGYFISYAGSDRLWAEWVAAELETAGETVVLQAWDAVPGENIVVWMSRSMAAARRTIALYSPSYFESSWCTAECTVALSRQVLLPFKVAECDPPAVLAAIGHISLHGVDEAAARRKLLRAAGLEETPRRFDGRFPGGSARRASAGNDADEAPVVPFPGSLPKMWNVRWRRPTWFVGRDAMLTGMYDRFRAAGVDRVSSQVVIGIGGVGKTQLAVEYAYCFAARYSLVWWVDAAASAAVVESFHGLADALRLPDDPDVERRARRALASLRDRTGWLVVFDNVEDRHLLADWWPVAGRGDVLVTGRSRMLGEFGEIRTVVPFSPDEAASLLRCRADHLSESDALRVAEVLGHLPLAISQAAAYLATTGVSADDYLELVATAVSTAFADSPSDYRAGLLGSVATAMDRLVRNDPPVAQALRLAGFLAPAPLASHVLDAVTAAVLPELPPVVARTRVLRGIDTSALAQVSSGTFELHRLTQAVLRAQLAVVDRERTIAQATDVLLAAAPADAGDPATWPVFAELAAHVPVLFRYVDGGGRPALRELVLAVVDYLTRTGQHAAAVRLAGTAVDTWTRLGGLDNLDRLAAAHRQGEALRGAGRFGEAEVVDRDTHARRLRVLGAQNRETLRSAGAVGLDLRGVGDRAGARDWNTAALATARAVLGGDDPQTLEIAGSLALDLHGLGEVAAARELDEEVLAGRRAVLGETHWQTLSSARNLARDLRALGLQEQARDLAQWTLETSLRVLGADHPDTLLAASSLAVLHYVLGDLEAARDLHQDSHSRSSRVLGPDHPHTLRIANSLAVDLFRLGDLQAAHDLHRDTFDRLRRALGDDHPETLHVAHNLARDLGGLGRYDDAVRLLEDTLRRRRSVLGSEHPETRRTERRLARTRGR